MLENLLSIDSVKKEHFELKEKEAKLTLIFHFNFVSGKLSLIYLQRWMMTWKNRVELATK